MTLHTAQSSQVLYPGLRYADAHAAISWLCAAFGFEKQVVYDGPDDTVAHAQLTLDGAVLMLGSARADGVYPGRTPRQLGGITGSIYVYVPDPDAHCARARAAGARIAGRPSELRLGAGTPRSLVCCLRFTDAHCVSGVPMKIRLASGLRTSRDSLRPIFGRYGIRRRAGAWDRETTARADFECRRHPFWCARIGMS